MPDARPIRVLLLDDYPVVRAGVRELLELTAEDIQVVGEAGTVAETVELARSLQPDVVLLDVRIGRDDRAGLAACPEVLAVSPTTACLVFTSSGPWDERLVIEAIQAGAVGYLDKSIGPVELAAAIRAVAAGGSMLDPQATARLFASIRSPDRAGQSAPLDRLSPQERAILRHIGTGRSNAEISRLMHLSEKTVRNYASVIYRKLGVHNRVEAARYSMRVTEEINKRDGDAC